MGKIDQLILHSCDGLTCRHHNCAPTWSELNLYLKDKRMAKLLLLLRQLHESAGGFWEFPHSEVREVVACAVELCGFGNAVEARDVISAILEAIGPEDPLPRISFSGD